MVTRCACENTVSEGVAYMQQQRSKYKLCEPNTSQRSDNPTATVSVCQPHQPATQPCTMSYWKPNDEFHRAYRSYTPDLMTTHA